MKLTTRDLVLCALCAAVICVLAPISVPLAGEIPISLATFAIMLSGVLTGSRIATLSVITYILLGVMGVPVFAGWTGGPGVILRMTGGYVLGYIPMAFITGSLYFRYGRNESGLRKFAVMFFSMVSATAVLYIFGTAWFVFQTKMTVAASMSVCVIPFLPGDLLKIAAIILIAPPVEIALKRAVPASEGAVF